MKKIISILILFVCSLQLFAALKLPSIIDDNMVLQQNKPNVIWGWANAGEKVNILFMHMNYSSITNKKGEWKISLDEMKATKDAKGNIMIISCENEKIVLKNILIGEVWLCSGQSNMEFPMSGFKDVYQKEIEKANDEELRFIVMKNVFDNHEAKDVALKSSWAAINPSTIEDCSAVAYFFAKKLRDKLSIPVGLVVSSWSGTPAQSWVDTVTLKDFPDYQKRYNDLIRPIDFSKLDQIKKEADEAYRKKIAEAAGSFRQTTSFDYNDDGWEKMELPGIWESKGHADLDGIVAYRISFTIPAGNENKAAVLHLPAIDDIDSTFINGAFIGSHNMWNELRIYNVPANILKAGKNIITIWVEDGGGGGGMNNDGENYYLQLQDQRISLRGEAKFKILAPIGNEAGMNYSSMQNQPAVLFNGMIAPLLPYNFAGVIWYQGESNADNYEEYRKLFPALINNWRKRFAQKDLPFLFVQLSSYNPDIIEPAESNWAGLREAQAETLELPKTGMAVTIDIGDQKDIHPKRKKEVGERLAANALGIVYGYKNLEYNGPTYQASNVSGNTIKVSYKNIGKGLVVKGDKLLGFSIAGADKKFVEATAVIEGDNVIVSSSVVNSPMYVRYAWADAPMSANLYNKDGFPAAPFRSAK